MFGALHCVVAYKGIDALNQTQADVRLGSFLSTNSGIFQRAKVLEQIYDDTQVP